MNWEKAVQMEIDSRTAGKGPQYITSYRAPATSANRECVAADCPNTSKMTCKHTLQINLQGHIQEGL